MNVGITLPTFEPTASAALAAAREAEAIGLDGVFSFDHLWPIGQPSRPALSAYPVLGAVSAVTRDVRIGTLVARVGLLPDRLVYESLVSLQEMAGGRLIAALGVGDRLSVPENEAYGIDWPSLEDRRSSLVAMLAELSAQGIECWVGATAPATLELAPRRRRDGESVGRGSGQARRRSPARPCDLGGTTSGRGPGRR